MMLECGWNAVEGRGGECRSRSNSWLFSLSWLSGEMLALSVAASRLPRRSPCCFRQSRSMFESGVRHALARLGDGERKNRRTNAARQWQAPGFCWAMHGRPFSQGQFLAGVVSHVRAR